MKTRFLKKRLAVLVAVMLLVCSVSAHAAVMVEIDYGTATISPDCGGDVYVSYSVRYAGSTHTASYTGYSYTLDQISLGVERGFLPYNAWVTNNSTYFLASAIGNAVYRYGYDNTNLVPYWDFYGEHTHSTTVVY